MTTYDEICLLFLASEVNIILRVFLSESRKINRKESIQSNPFMTTQYVISNLQVFKILDGRLKLITPRAGF